MKKYVETRQNSMTVSIAYQEAPGCWIDLANGVSDTQSMIQEWVRLVHHLYPGQAVRVTDEEQGSSLIFSNEGVET